MTLNKKLAVIISAVLALFTGGTMLGSGVGEAPTFVTASSTVFYPHNHFTEAFRNFYTVSR